MSLERLPHENLLKKTTFLRLVALMPRIGELLGLKPRSGLLFIRAISAFRGQMLFPAPRTAVITSGRHDLSTSSNTDVHG